MNKVYLKKVTLSGIHKRYSLDIEFNETLNVLHGHNGTGKSTLIHIIANIANCDFFRFAYLDFDKICVSYSNGSSITLEEKEKAEEKIVEISTSNGEVFEFSKKLALEMTRIDDDERGFESISHEAIEHLNSFVEKNELKHVKTSYFPAFRTMLEAWASQSNSRLHPNHRRSNIKQTTSFARNIFSQFLPTINFPSPLDIENNLRNEIREAQISIARYESSVFSDSFVKVFNALLNKPNYEINTDALLSEISELTSKTNTSKLGDYESNSNTYRQLQALVESSHDHDNLATSAASALAVYRDALQERQNYQLRAFKEIDKYFKVVNDFLDKKELTYELDKRRRIPKVGLQFPDKTWSSIKVMSSGERQLLTMLYAVNKMSGNSVVLIDEPELSLHIDWQEDLLERMVEQLGERQIIVCTHSPSIAADFEEYMKEVIPVYIDSKQEKLKENEFDDEDFF